MTTSHVEVPGGRLLVADEGSGPPIVLLHAGIADLRSWDAMVPLLIDAGYRIGRYDARGVGGSTTDDVKFSNRADLVAVLNAQGIGRAALVGNSALERIGPLQAQEPASPYIALWSCLDGFEAAVLDRAIHERRLVKAGLLRGTLHLVSADDYLQLQTAIRAILQGLAVQDQYRNAEVSDIESLIEAALAFGDEPRDNAAMHDHLADLVAAEGRTSADVWWRVRREGALIRTPSKVSWSFDRRPTYVAARAWLEGRAFADDQAALVHLIRRYLGAFGPATLGDLRAWSHESAARLRPAIEALPDVVKLRDDAGRTLLDLADAPRPLADTPAPPRFLPM